MIDTLSPSDINTSPLDILAELDVEALVSTDPLMAIEAGATSISETDLLRKNVLSQIDTVIATSAAAPLPSARKSGAFREKLTFLFHYTAVSGVVFAILMVTANWTAYWNILSNLVHPETLQASGREISETLEKSRITVFANESKTEEESSQKKENAEDIRKQLDAEHISIDEDPFSMKHLLPAVPDIKVNFEIVPYENRIVIPKIGKNVPLVDVTSTSNMDFDHMENIFMKELEKGIVRYPGTARPGEKGNAFIFGHSSNYPWMSGSYNEVFALLDNLEFNDEIIVYYNQRKYVYVVREKKIVKP